MTFGQGNVVGSWSKMDEAFPEYIYLVPEQLKLRHNHFIDTRYIADAVLFQSTCVVFRLLRLKQGRQGRKCYFVGNHCTDACILEDSCNVARKLTIREIH